jgi:hypothetical protein
MRPRNRFLCVTAAAIGLPVLLTASTATWAAEGPARLLDPVAVSWPGERAQPMCSVLTASARADRADAQSFVEAARTAWAFVDRNYQERTGLVSAHDSYSYVTLWDIASTLAAYHGAYQLGFIDEADFERRTRTALRTLRDMPLFRDAAYNKQYDARTGSATDRNERPTREGFGWSAIDMGRFLVWMKILEEHHPQLSGDIHAVMDRLDLGRLVEDGYLMGEDVVPGGTRMRRYPEGRIGYEQYAAEGFALWGHRADRALDFLANAKPITVYGVSLYGDQRGDDRLTSDPFLMMGLELGWRSDAWVEMGCRMLAAQEARYDATGQITMVNEDAVPVPPNYFYYYSVYNDGEQFPVVPPTGGGGNRDSPRWVSAKAAYGWHALAPSEYTEKAVAAVRSANSAQGGWSAGVYEGSGESTGAPNINTAGVILQSALYVTRGAPLIDR